MRTPLPQMSVIDTHIESNYKIRGYTEKQMITYGQASYVRGLLDAPKAQVASAEAYRCGYEAGVVAERAECATVIEEYPYWLGTVAKQEIAAAIRARIKT